MQRQYEISYRPKDNNNHLGPKRSFIATLSKGSLKAAQKKLRCKGVIIGIKTIK